MFGHCVGDPVTSSVFVWTGVPHPDRPSPFAVDATNEEQEYASHSMKSGATAIQVCNCPSPRAG